MLGVLGVIGARCSWSLVLRFLYLLSKQLVGCHWFLAWCDFRVHRLEEVDIGIPGEETSPEHKVLVLDFQRRKRRIDLDIEAIQLKLRLIEMERERFKLYETGSLGVAHSSSAAFANFSRASPPSPRANSTPIDEDAIVQRLSRAFSSA